MMDGFVRPPSIFMAVSPWLISSSRAAVLSLSICRKQPPAALILRIMSGKRTYSPSRVGGKGGKRWTQATRQRLEAAEHHEVAPLGRSTKRRWEEASASMTPSIPAGASRPDPGMIEDMEKAWNTFLMSSCLRLADFNPVENTAMVCGRPVQVS